MSKKPSSYWQNGFTDKTWVKLSSDGVVRILQRNTIYVMFAPKLFKETVLPKSIFPEKKI